MSSEEKSNEHSGFVASFPDVQSAITFHGAGGMRIQLDIPENQLGEAAKLLMWRNSLLKVVIAPIDKDSDDFLFNVELLDLLDLVE